MPSTTHLGMVDDRDSHRDGVRCTMPAACAEGGVRGNGTDQGHGVNFDHQDGSAVDGGPGCDEVGAYANVARHAVNCAEWRGTRDVACRNVAQTGWPGVRAS